MTTIKTAISIEETLFHRAEKAAEALEVSRSRLISLALESYLSRYEADLITAKLNEVYADGPTAEEKEQLEAMWNYHVRLTKDDRW
jgi:predicted transcriptional regulator